MNQQESIEFAQQYLSDILSFFGVNVVIFTLVCSLIIF